MEQEQSFEKQLIKYIKEANAFIEEFETRVQDNLQVILLIGNTGAGKSTIFNFLAGAEIQFIESEDDDDELKVISSTDQFSAMKAGMISITRQPKYFFSDDYKHLLIDFPGFQDTRGEMDKLMIEMLFLKIITKSPIKIVFVLRHPENDFSDRGAVLQDFIKKQFQEQSFDSSCFTLILNSYQEELEDEALKQRVQKQLKNRFQKANENICVVRKITDNESLQHIFSAQKRDQLWKDLTQSKAIKFISKKLSNSATISRYLSNKIEKIIFKYCESLTECLNSLIFELNNEQLLELKNLIDSLAIVLQKNNLKGGNWYVEYVSACEQIFALLKCDIYIIDQGQDFMFIVEYFLQYQGFIEGIDECKKVVELAKTKCQFVLKIINIKSTQLEDYRKQQEQMNIQKQQILNEIKKRDEIENQFKSEINKCEQNKEQIKSLQHKYNEIKNENQKLTQEQQKQLQEFQEDQKKTIQLRKEQDQQLMNSIFQNTNNMQSYILKLEEQSKKAEEQRQKQQREFEMQQRKIEEQRLRDEELRRQEEKRRQEESIKQMRIWQERKKEMRNKHENYLKWEISQLQEKLNQKRFQLQSTVGHFNRTAVEKEISDLSANLRYHEQKLRELQSNQHCVIA